MKKKLLGLITVTLFSIGSMQATWLWVTNKTNRRIGVGLRDDHKYQGQGYNMEPESIMDGAGQRLNPGGTVKFWKKNMDKDIWGPVLFRFLKEGSNTPSSPSGKYYEITGTPVHVPRYWTQKIEITEGSQRDADEEPVPRVNVTKPKDPRGPQTIDKIYKKGADGSSKVPVQIL